MTQAFPAERRARVSVCCIARAQGLRIAAEPGGAAAYPSTLLMTAVLMVTGYCVARRRGYGVESFPGVRKVLSLLVAAVPGLGLVALIFVGIRAGIFTAVESAGTAAPVEHSS